MAPLVSIIIPTWNEAADIRETLDSLMALEHDPLEVLVVDASTDATPEIVASYPLDRVRLIRQTRGRGRAAARNEGILAARGEIVIILNADVRLPRDFVRRILPLYAAGADYVLVESRVTNLEHAVARYVQAMHEHHYPPGSEVESRMNWTEGFSCRRDAAAAVGLIPEGGAAPLLAGEDGWFGENLAAAGYHKAMDRSIVVTHVMPADLKTFWHQRLGRGRGAVQIWHQRDGWPLARIAREVAAACLLTGAALMIPLPSLYRAVVFARYSPRRAADWLPFAALDWVTSAANLWGLIAEAMDLRRAQRRRDDV